MTFFRGTRRDDHLIGTQSNDTLEGHRGNDHLEGLSGSDFLKGGSGSDRLNGGLGFDYLDGGSEADWMIGGGGIDYALYRSATQGLTASLVNPTINTGDAAGDTYFGIVGLWGSNFNDVLIGNSAQNYLIGGPGADLLNGGNGFDYAKYDSRDNVTGITANLSNPALNRGSASGDQYVSIEGLVGTVFSDRLIGNDRANIFYGREGADVFVGGRGADDIYCDGVDSARDRVQYTSLLDSGLRSATRDEVFLFVHRQDKIDLKSIDADPSLAGNQAFHVVAALTSKRGEVRLLNSGADTIVQVDGGWDSAVDMAIRVVGVHLTAADLIL